MHCASKMKKIFLSMLAMVIAPALICPQALFAKEMPGNIEGQKERPQLVSFELYDKMKVIDAELLEGKKEITITASEKDVPEINSYTDASGDVIKIEITGDDLDIILNSANEDTDEGEIQPAETVVEERPPSGYDVPITIHDSHEIEINEEGTGITRDTRSLSEICINEPPGTSTVIPSKAFSGADSKSNLSKEDNTAAKPVNHFVDTDRPALISADIKINDKKDDKPLEIDETEYAPAIKRGISRLLKARNAASKKFYSDSTLYYEELMPLLKKAGWLWKQRTIDPHFYCTAANGVLDGREVRKIVEDAIAYLYEYVPSDKSEETLRTELLSAERGLRAKYVGPALAAYNNELKEASREFYKTVKDAIQPLINPFVNKTRGGIEVIIDLPKTSLK